MSRDAIEPRGQNEATTSVANTSNTTTDSAFPDLNWRFPDSCQSPNAFARR